MADRLVSELTEITSVATTDELYVESGLNGRKISAANLGDTLPITPTGGTTARTLAGHLGDRLNAFDFIASSLHAAIAAGTSTDDVTTELQAAWDASNSEGRPVEMLAGLYNVSADLTTLNFTKVKGLTHATSNSRATPSNYQGPVITWVGAGNPTNAVVVSNPTASRAIELENIQINVNGKTNGMEIRGWNENCRLSDVEIQGFTGTGLFVGQIPAGAITNQATFERLKILPRESPAKSIVLNNARRLLMHNITIDLQAVGTGPSGTGMELEAGVIGCTFINMYFENCTLPIDIGTDGTGHACFNNIWISPHFTNPEFEPGDTTVGSDTGRMAIVVRADVIDYEILNARFEQSLGTPKGFDWLLVDAGRARKIVGNNTASGIDRVQRVIAAQTQGQNEIWLTDDQHVYSGMRVDPNEEIFTDADATPDVTGATRFKTNNTGSTTITDFDGGEDTQEIEVRFGDANTTIANNANILLANDNLINPTANSIMRFRRIGTAWLELSRTIQEQTRNSASNTITSGTTSRTINHGLDVTPLAEHFTITGKENPTNSVGTVWVDTITSTQATVNVENDPGASGWDFGWRVDASI